MKLFFVVNQDDEKRLYPVVETKSSHYTDGLRDAESSKIKCGKAHFEALAIGESPARYEVATSFEDLMARC